MYIKSKTSRYNVVILPFVLLLMLMSCNPSTTTSDVVQSELDIPAIPPAGTSPAQTLQYIADTDQGDRATLTEEDIRKLLQQRQPRVDSIDYRDSLRYSVLWDLHIRGLIKTPTDKYNAGVVFTHSGGSRIKDDTLSWNLAKQNLLEASETGDSVLRSKALYFLDFVEFRLKPKELGLNLEIN